MITARPPKPLAGKAINIVPQALALRPAGHGLHPDGDLTDTRRARKRGITLSSQQYDGMSRLSSYPDPQARATLADVLARLPPRRDQRRPHGHRHRDAAAIDRDAAKPNATTTGCWPGCACVASGNWVT